jgi:hypothetical protein
VSVRSVSNTDRQCNPRLFGDGFVPGMVWYGMVPLLPPVSVFCH